ncbi:hypothetical protein CTI12_AA371370 [Artemisia annua]|uniref:Uncharacterized protein n=1 Tax=Artemisia annua TaxID=35608 RepID=A0A2U1MK64_ARTAN|nr:hypothetical protein CTI12_AA371370 [Artemisia annua]
MYSINRPESSGKVASNGTGDDVVNQEKNKSEGTPGFKVYVNKRPTSMSEVIKDLEAQFLNLFLFNIGLEMILKLSSLTGYLEAQFLFDRYLMG